MANPATLIINELTGNESITAPAGQLIDTAGTVNMPSAQSVTDRIILHVINTAARAATVVLKAGVKPPAERASLGDLTLNFAATGTATDKQIIGPFESARFAKADGSVDVAFAAVGGAPGFTVNVYRLPKAV